MIHMSSNLNNNKSPIYGPRNLPLIRKNGRWICSRTTPKLVGDLVAELASVRNETTLNRRTLNVTENVTETSLWRHCDATQAL